MMARRAYKFKSQNSNAMELITATTLLSRSIEELTNAELKEAITAKFGNLSHFCRLTERGIKELHDNLRYRTEKSTAYLAAALSDAKRLANVPVDGYHLTEEARKKLSNKLLAYASIRAFCEKHKDFSNVFVSRVIHGHTDKVTPKVRALAKTLSVAI